MKRGQLLLLIGTTLLGSPVLQAEPFVFISLPDTQAYAENRFPDGRLPPVTDPRGTAAIFFDQTRWIVDSADRLRIRYVGHLGDIVEHGENLDEWTRAKAAMDLLLEADIPHGTVMGNHDDVVEHGVPYQINYLANFGPQVFEDRSWYAGASPSGGANYQLLEHGYLKLGFLNFSIDHPQAELDWARDIIADNPDTIFVIGTHRYLYDLKLAAGRYSETVPSPFGPLRIEEDPVPGAVDPNTAQELFDELIALHPNILMVHAGHFHSEWLRLDERNNAQQRIIQILTDYQDTRNGGDGWLRKYELDFENGTFSFDTYSPTLNRKRTTIDHLVESIYLAYQMREQVMAALGLTEEQYLALLQSLKNTPAPDGFLLLHPDFDEATEQDYYNTYLAELFQGVIPPGFEVIAEWEGLWLQAFAANPTNPFDFSDGPRSPSQTLTVDYDAYFTPSPEQLVQKNLAEAIAALQGLDPEDFALPPSQRVLIAKVKLALAKFEHGLGRVSRILLERTVVRRMDGCTLRGEPDTRAGFDTVVNCPAQERVYPHVVAAVELLGELQ